MWILKFISYIYGKLFSNSIFYKSVLTNRARYYNLRNIENHFYHSSWLFYDHQQPTETKKQLHLVFNP